MIRQHHHLAKDRKSGKKFGKNQRNLSTELLETMDSHVGLRKEDDEKRSDASQSDLSTCKNLIATASSQVSHLTRIMILPSLPRAFWLRRRDIDERMMRTLRLMKLCDENIKDLKEIKKKLMT